MPIAMSLERKRVEKREKKRESGGSAKRKREGKRKENKEEKGREEGELATKTRKKVVCAFVLGKMVFS